MARSETFQKFFAVGKLEKEPDIRALSSGTPVANLSMSTESSYKDKAGDWKTKKEFHKVSIFGQAANSLGAATIGTLISVVGVVETRSYETNGEKKYTTEIKAELVSIVGQSSDTSAAPQTTRSAPAQTRAASVPTPRAVATQATRAVASDPFGDDTGITDDDIPF